MSTPIEIARVRKHFNRAAATYDTAAVLQRELTQRLLENFDYMRVNANVIVDVGCGTGAAVPALRTRFPDAHLIALDLAENMVRKAAPPPSFFAKYLRRNIAHGLAADFSQLPLASASVDVIVSNFALHWSPDLPATMRELARVLKVGGLLLFSVPGPDTLKELRRATNAVHAFPDMHDVGDMMVAAGLADPVMARDDLALTYDTPEALLADMKALGVTFAGEGASKGLMGKAAFAQMKAKLDAQRVTQAKPGTPPAHVGKIPATYEVVTGHAWKVAPKKTSDGHAIVEFDPKRRGRV
jgi:malonyl-CoA O-methyltransferase